MNRSALDVEIIVGNEYEMKSIPVSLAQTSKYEVDSIVYDWKSLLYSDNTLEPDYSLVVNNSKSDQRQAGTSLRWKHLFRVKFLLEIKME